MGSFRSVFRCLLVLVALGANPAADAAVIDIGDVTVSGNDLRIGDTADGQRAVESAGDGPYGSVVLGVSAGVSGSLLVDAASTFATTGALGIGVAGSGNVEVRAGSQLRSASATLGSPTLSSISISGVGSSWINEGPLSITSRHAVVHLADGAHFSTNGIASAVLEWNSAIEVTIEGMGAKLENLGTLSIGGSGHDIRFIIREGGEMIDSGANIRVAYGPLLSVTVTDPGSSWVSGDVTFSDRYFEILNGASARMNSLTLTYREVGSGVSVRGNGSRVEVAGLLTSYAGNGNNIRVVDGGYLSSVGGDVGGYTAVDVSGQGAWSIVGDLRISLAYTFGHMVISGGGQVLGRNADFVRCFGAIDLPCRGIEIRDPSSLWHNSENVSINGPTVVSNAGTLSAGNELAILSAGSVNLADGNVTAANIRIADGLLSGHGSIEADVANEGRIVPGDGPGSLSITGSFVQSATGLLQIALTGQSNAGAGVLTVDGPAALDGELAVVLADGFMPEVGDVFRVLACQSRNGEFARLSGLDLGNGLILRPVYDESGLLLIAVSRAAAGAVVGWGLDHSGQATPPLSVNGVGGTAFAIAAGDAHSCAIRAVSNEVVCWGDDSLGRASPPSAVNGVSGAAVAVAAGSRHSCAIQATTGTVVCWGDNGAGQAAPPLSLAAASVVSAGDYHSCAIQAETGRVVCWGANWSGQAAPPVSVNGTTGTARSLAVGWEHSCAIQKGTGSVVCWGDDLWGQATPPASVDGSLGTASAIVAGSYHTCAIQTGTGEVVCWGSNGSGRATPPPLVNGTEGTAIDVAAGGEHGCAIRAGNGVAVCWGDNEHGKTVPSVEVDGTLGFASEIAAGGEHSLAISTLGSGPRSVPASSAAGLLTLVGLLGLTMIRFMHRQVGGQREKN